MKRQGQRYPALSSYERLPKIYLFINTFLRRYPSSNARVTSLHRKFKLCKNYDMDFKLQGHQLRDSDEDEFRGSREFDSDNSVV